MMILMFPIRFFSKSVGRWVVIPVILTCALCAVPDVIHASADDRVFKSNGAEFRFTDGVLTIVVGAPGNVREAMISSKGEITIDDHRVDQSRRDRSLGRRFFKESFQLAGCVDEIGELIAAQADSTMSEKARSQLARDLAKLSKKADKHAQATTELGAELAMRLPQLSKLLAPLAE